MGRQTGIDQGRTVHQNAGLGQKRVGEHGPGPDQEAPPSSAGGPGTGGGDDRPGAVPGAPSAASGEEE